MDPPILNKRVITGIALAALAVAAVAAYDARSRLLPFAALPINYVRTLHAPAGTLTIETAPAGAAAAAKPTASPSPPLSADWPSFNRTLRSERFSPLTAINRDNVATLKVACSYETHTFSSFQTGPIIVNGALIGTTEEDIFSIDPATCREHWRTHEHLSHVAVNRGAAYWDGLLYRGTGDGRVIAYDFKTGARAWVARIADADAGEWVSAAPIAWNGLVYLGNSGGDYKGVKGRMYALDAKSGRIVWEFYLVPKGPHDVARGPLAGSPPDASSWRNAPQIPITGGATWTSYSLDTDAGELYIPAGNSAPDFAPDAHPGANLYSGSVVVLDARTGAYKRHVSLTAGDWHDWDVSNTPALLQTRGGKHLVALAPKDGYLYGIDQDRNAVLYRSAVTRIENAQVPFSTDAPVHFCPGARGGGEWNGAAYDPNENLLFVGEVDWCSTVTAQSRAKIVAVKPGKNWSAMATHNPYDTFGRHDPYPQWGGWVYANDADTGAWVWRARSNYPVQSGLTATAGGVVLFGDMGGNFYALDSASGRRLWSQNLGGAIGGGVVTYAVGGMQKVAVAVGFTAVLWPTQVTTAKILVLALPAAAPAP